MFLPDVAAQGYDSLFFKGKDADAPAVDTDNYELSRKAAPATI